MRLGCALAQQLDLITARCQRRRYLQLARSACVICAWKTRRSRQRGAFHVSGGFGLRDNPAHNPSKSAVFEYEPQTSPRGVTASR